MNNSGITCLECKFNNNNNDCTSSEACISYSRFVARKPKTMLDNLTKHCKIPTMPYLQIVLNDKIDLLEKKNNDYGNSFEKILDKFVELGIDPYLSIYTRIHDKFSRFESLTIAKHEQQIKDDSVSDTLRDLSNYVDLFLAWKLKQQDKE